MNEVKKTIFPFYFLNWKPNSYETKQSESIKLDENLI